MIQFIQSTLPRLLFLYVVWGSSYLAVRMTMLDFPPFTLMAIRCLLAGGLLCWWGLKKGSRVPSPLHIAGAALLGFLMLGMHNAGTAYAMQWVSSGLASISSATVGLWVACFSTLLGRKLTRLQWLGVALGALSVLVLNAGGTLRANPQGAAALILGNACWALGTVLAVRWMLPAGEFLLGVQYLSGGVWLSSLALASGEKMQAAPSLTSLAYLAYLTGVASVLGFIVYDQLQRENEFLSTSCAFVNPLVAVTLGACLGGEAFPPYILGSLAIVLGALGCLAYERVPQKWCRRVTLPARRGVHRLWLSMFAT